MSHRTESSGTSTDERHLSRRTLVKAGAHAAWTVPLVQLAAAAPALAASGPASLTITAPTPVNWSGGQKQNLSLSAQITNQNTGPTTALKLTFTFPAGWKPTVTSAPSGWTLLSGSGTDTIVFQPTSQLNGNNSMSFGATKFSLPNNGFRGATGDILAAATTGGTSGSNSTSIHVNKAP